ncbi:hypothetical protein PPBDW_I21271 [Photobacterium kishitanii]|nr:hypothetical protein PPBDW_I21271 [Photobacterium kishitanii]
MIPSNRGTITNNTEKINYDSVNNNNALFLRPKNYYLCSIIADAFSYKIEKSGSYRLTSDLLSVFHAVTGF